MNRMLKLDHVSKTYRVGKFGGKELHAVNDVSFEVQAGEVVSLIGESGSGTTTLSRLLLRLLDSTGGQILFHGQDVTNQHNNRNLKRYWQKVQAVFQDPFAAFNQFYTNRHVLGNALNVLDENLSEKEKLPKVKSSLVEVGLDPVDVLDKWPHQLSGGQVQRVMIARALAIGPELLIADEPTSMLDASLRVTVLNLVRDLRKRHNMGILFITHDLGQAGDITTGTTILDGIKAITSGQVQFNRFGKFDNIKDTSGNPAIADVGIVVIGEEPYAEGVGDRADLTLSEFEADLIQRVRAQQ